MANFPNRKQSQNLNTLAFPNDLLSNSSRPYMTINFVNYRSAFYGSTILGKGLSNLVSDTTGAVSRTTVGNALNTAVSNFVSLINLPNIPSKLLRNLSSGTFYLPIPRKLNEGQTNIWTETSLFESVNLPSSFGLPSALTGFQVNPFQLLYYQRPAFREFSFSWTFAPNSPQESETLRTIVNEFRKFQLPTAKGVVFDYPAIALVRFVPNNLNEHIKLKPCAITSMTVDHVGGPNPSFFKNSRGAPTIVNLQINLKEIEIQTTNDYTGVKVASSPAEFVNNISGVIGNLISNSNNSSDRGGTTPRNDQ